MCNMIERMPFCTKHYFVELGTSAQLLRGSRRRWTQSRTKVNFRLENFAPNNCFLYRTAELSHTKHLLQGRQVHLKLKKVSKNLVSQLLDSPMSPFTGKFWKREKNERTCMYGHDHQIIHKGNGTKKTCKTLPNCIARELLNSVFLPCFFDFPKMRGDLESFFFFNLFRENPFSRLLRPSEAASAADKTLLVPPSAKKMS